LSAASPDALDALDVRMIDVELIVAATQSAPMDPAMPAGFAAASRTLVAAAADLLVGVQRAMVGPANVRTARDNAWAAMLADRARQQARDELSREVAALVAADRRRRRSFASAR
jgi:hypothetical protein